MITKSVRVPELKNAHRSGVAIDFDPVLVEDANNRMEERWKFVCQEHDILSGPIEGRFNAAYSLDVIEHIPTESEGKFMFNIAQSLDENGVLIIGTPSIQSQVYGSQDSKEGHVNCKDHDGLKKLGLKYFQNVFMFSMNDEVVHTGFHAMAHYLWALCVTPKSNNGS
ncbi:MAG: hypothetical protein IH912_10520 [Proteobacteria bacterium]|nr:hypothetical protein [Pseudomonadota bacterium]